MLKGSQEISQEMALEEFEPFLIAIFLLALIYGIYRLNVDTESHSLGEKRKQNSKTKPKLSEKKGDGGRKRQSQKPTTSKKTHGRHHRQSTNSAHHEREAEGCIISKDDQDIEQQLRMDDNHQEVATNTPTSHQYLTQPLSVSPWPQDTQYVENAASAFPNHVTPHTGGSDADASESSTGSCKQKRRKKKRTRSCCSSLSRISHETTLRPIFAVENCGYYEFTVTSFGGVVKLPFCKICFPADCVNGQTRMGVKPVNNQIRRKGEKKVVFLTSAIHFREARNFNKPIGIYLKSKHQIKAGSTLDVEVHETESSTELDWKVKKQLKVQQVNNVFFTTKDLWGFRAVATCAATIEPPAVLKTLYYIVLIKRPSCIKDPKCQILVVNLSSHQSSAHQNEVLLNYQTMSVQPGMMLTLSIKGNEAIKTSGDLHTFRVPELEEKFQEDFHFELNKKNPSDEINIEEVMEVSCVISDNTSKPRKSPIKFRWAVEVPAPAVNVNVHDSAVGFKINVSNGAVPATNYPGMADAMTESNLAAVNLAEVEKAVKGRSHGIAKLDLNSKPYTSTPIKPLKVDDDATLSNPVTDDVSTYKRNLSKDSGYASGNVTANSNVDEANPDLSFDDIMKLD